MATDGIALHHAIQQDSVEVPKTTWRDYTSILKLGITVANLMATFAGLWVGSHGHPHLMASVYTLLGTAFVVAGGAALNNYVDRDIDHRMKRTIDRALATGKVPAQAALWMGIGLGVAGTVILGLLVNVPAAACAFLGLIVYSYFYTVWLKRTTTLSTVFGGIAGAMPPVVGFAGGSGGELGIAAWVLFALFFLWQPPHFLPLAMKRSEEYRAAGIPMLPVVKGYRETKWQILRYTAAMLPVSVLLYGLRYEGRIYLAVSLVLGFVFLVKAVQGIYAKDDLQWASKLFGFSLLYLTALCVAMVISAR